MPGESYYRWFLSYKSFCLLACQARVTIGGFSVINRSVYGMPGESYYRWFLSYKSFCLLACQARVTIGGFSVINRSV